MPDVIELIKTDHQALEKLFVQLEKEPPNTGDLLIEVRDLLVPHSHAEEKVVYPAIKKSAPDESQDVDDGVAEHQHVADMLTKVLGESPDDPGADGLVAAIIGEVRHHVGEEENDILPKFRQAVSQQVLDDLGERFNATKASELEKLQKS